MEVRASLMWSLWLIAEFWSEEKKWNHLHDEAKLSGNVTRIKTGVAIEGNWGDWKKRKKGIVVARTVKSYQWAVDVCWILILLVLRFCSRYPFLFLLLLFKNVSGLPALDQGLVYLPLFIATNQGSWLALGCKWSNWGKRHNLMISYVTIGQEAYNNPKPLSKEA